MDPQTLSRLADAVLLVHVGIVLFNVFGLVAIPLGAWRRWSFVRIFWWRAVHLGILAIVALQAVLQRACVLTLWQSDLMRASGAAASDAPLLQSWLGRLLYWDLPMWVFVALYVAVCAYTLLLWILVPPRLRKAGAMRASP